VTWLIINDYKSFPQTQTLYNVDEVSRVVYNLNETDSTIQSAHVTFKDGSTVELNGQDGAELWRLISKIGRLEK
jgi:hypothetical protein